MVKAQNSAPEPHAHGAESILVGVDGTEPSLRAIAYAAGLAGRHDSPLVIVYARTSLPAAVMALDAMGAAALALRREHQVIEAEIRDSLDHFISPLDTQVEVKDGSPVKVISEVAADVHAGAVVVGARFNPFPYSTGPLSAQLIRLRRWPVIVVP